MKYSKKAFLKDIYGEPVMHEVRKINDGSVVMIVTDSPEPHKEHIMCHDLLIDILLHAAQKTKPSDEDKFKRAKIAVRIANSKDTFDLNESERKMIKEMVGYSCDPLPTYYLWQFLDNPIDKQEITVVDIGATESRRAASNV